jgi:putative phosphoesterase
VEIAIISDTHMPRGRRRLPDGCVARLKAADLIIHAGDLSAMSVLEELREYGEVAAVHGNVDDAEVRAALPSRTAITPPGGPQIGVIHDAGPARGRIERLRKAFPDARAVIFGHSHIPLHERSADGFQIFNPGSPTVRRRQPAFTMGLAHARGDRVSFRLITLD